MTFPSHSRPTYAMGGLVWLLVFFSFFTTEYAANPKRVISSGNPLNEPPNDARVRRADPPCIEGRAYICFAFEALGQPIPEWLGKAGVDCSPCVTDIICSEKAWSARARNEDRLAVYPACRPKLCTGTESTNEKDCITPVSINGGKILLPFNLCTREMLMAGDCDDKPLYSDELLAGNTIFTPKYLAECDAGFVVPKRIAILVSDNDTDHFQCVQSLHQTAGFLKEDPSPLQNYPYDNLDPKNFTYCENGGRIDVKSTCQPLPLCLDINKTIPRSPYDKEFVDLATDCDQPCVYQYGRSEYNDCVFLDLADPSAKRIYPARRAKSGPYAYFMDKEENVMVDMTRLNTTDVPTTEEPEPSDYHERKRWFYRRGIPDGAIRYPKCINTASLSGMNRKRVEIDLMLNCKTNIFVQIYGRDGLMIEPPICDGYKDLSICSNKTAPSIVTSRFWEYSIGISVALMAVVVTGAGIRFVLKKYGYIRLPAVPLPELQLAKNIRLEEQDIPGNWMDSFTRVITGKPPIAKPGKLAFSTEGHVALQIDKAKLKAEDRGVKVKAGRFEAEKCTAAGQALPPLGLAKKFFTELADGRLVSPGNGEPRIAFDPPDLVALFEYARDVVVAKYRGVARINGAAWIIGDIRGDFNTLSRVFAAYAAKATPGQNMVFLGNIVDGGSRQLMSLVLVVAGLVLHPDTICYVSGNHELASCHRQYGFLHQLKDEGYPDYLYACIRGFFDALPLIAIIDQRIMAVHGGIGPEVTANVIRDGFDPRGPLTRTLKNALLWSDPNHNIRNYADNLIRGVGYCFGVEAIADFRHRMGIDFIIRAHQEMNTGMHFFGDWLISLYTTCRRDSGEERQGIRDTDKDANAEIGGVLVYDGNQAFTMVHFIPLYNFYASHAKFTAAFNRKIVKDGVFAEANYDTAFMGI